MSSQQASDNEIQQKISQDQLKHTKEIIKNGKQIAPFLDEQTLVNLFKLYYSNENVFYSELEIRKKIRKAETQNRQNQNRGDWITVGKQVKKRSNTNGGLAKYNFLEDKELIKRARNWNASKPHVENRENQQKKTNFKQKQRAYKEKQQHSQKTQYKQKKETIEKPKEQQYKEPQHQIKQHVQKKQTLNKNIHAEPKQAQQNTEQKNKKIKYQQKKLQNNKKSHENAKKEDQNPKPKHEYQQKIVKQTKETMKKVFVEKSQKKEQSLKNQTELRFQQECAKNKLILKFIKPTEKVQKISYVLRNGNVEEVKTRLILPSRD